MFKPGEVGRPLFKTFTARLFASGGSLILIVTLGRLYGAAGVGVFALAQSLTTATAILGRYGVDNALIRFIGRDIESSKIRSYLQYACRRTSILSFSGACLVLIFRHNFGILFHSDKLPNVLIGVAVAIPFYSFCFVLSGFMAAVRRPATACLLQNGVVGFVTAICICILDWLNPNHGYTNIGTAYAIASLLTCVVGGVITLRWISNNASHRFPLSLTDIAKFRKSASAFLASDIATFMISVVGIWIAGFWLAATDVGIYQAAAQFSMLIGFILAVINLVIPARFSALYFCGDIDGLRNLVRQGALIGIALAAVPILLCLVAPEVILGLVGGEFTGADSVLRILATGQLIDISCGSVGHLLNMSGREPLARNIAWTANICGLIVLIFATPIAGVVGVALGVAFSMALRKVLGVYFVWRQLGIWTPPFPNVLQTIGISVLSNE